MHTIFKVSLLIKVFIVFDDYLTFMPKRKCWIGRLYSKCSCTGGWIEHDLKLTLDSETLGFYILSLDGQVWCKGDREFIESTLDEFEDSNFWHFH